MRSQPRVLERAHTCRPSQKRVYAAFVRKTRRSESAEPTRLCGLKEKAGSAGKSRYENETSVEKTQVMRMGWRMRTSVSDFGVSHRTRHQSDVV